MDSLWLAEALLGPDKLLPTGIYHIRVLVEAPCPHNSSGKHLFPESFVTYADILPPPQGWEPGLQLHVATEIRNVYDTGDAIKGHSSDLVKELYESMENIELGGGTVDNAVTGVPKGHGYVAPWKPAEMLP